MNALFKHGEIRAGIQWLATCPKQRAGVARDRKCSHETDSLDRTRGCDCLCQKIGIFQILSETTQEVRQKGQMATTLNVPLEDSDRLVEGYGKRNS